MFLLSITEEKKALYEEGICKVKAGLREIATATEISYVNIAGPVLATISGFVAEYELRPDLLTENEKVKATRQVSGQIRSIRHDMNLLTEAIGGSFESLKNKIPRKEKTIIMCEDCNKVFKGEQYFQNHGCWPKNCPDCNLKVSSRRQMRNHQPCKNMREDEMRKKVLSFRKRIE